VARRLLYFARSELERGPPRDVAEWRDDYLGALRSGRAPGARSEPLMARTVLNRMARIAGGNPQR